MEREDKISAVTAVGYPEEQTPVWFLKFRRHKDHARDRGLVSELTFAQYVEKAQQAGMKGPEEIGIKIDQHHLSRHGDEGPYRGDTCRFITSSENLIEAHANGRHDARLQFQKGETKETHARVASMADKKAKEFVLTAPDGTFYEGKNLEVFCKEHGLNRGGMANVCRGLRPHHKGWTGNYGTLGPDLVAYFDHDE